MAVECEHMWIGRDRPDVWWCTTCGAHFVPASKLEEGELKIALLEDRIAALAPIETGLDIAREALCQIANGIPGPCLHATETLQAIAVERQCTCHPDDNPPRPCPKKYALSECRKAAGSE